MLKTWKIKEFEKIFQIFWINSVIFLKNSMIFLKNLFDKPKVLPTWVGDSCEKTSIKSLFNAILRKKCYGQWQSFFKIFSASDHTLMRQWVWALEMGGGLSGPVNRLNSAATSSPFLTRPLMSMPYSERSLGRLGAKATSVSSKMVPCRLDFKHTISIQREMLVQRKSGY